MIYLILVMVAVVSYFVGAERGYNLAVDDTNKFIDEVLEEVRDLRETLSFDTRAVDTPIEIGHPKNE